MTKKIHIVSAFLALLAVVMSSCWQTGEDISFCPGDENLILRFNLETRLVNGSGQFTNVKFTDVVETVDVFLFDSKMTYLDHRHLTREMLDNFQGTSFDVIPGKYHVICWSNVDDEHTAHRLGAGAFSPEMSFVEIIAEDSGSPLYYAPNKEPVLNSNTRAGSVDYSGYEIIVDGHERELVVDIYFSKAHRMVELFIAGFENIATIDGATPPIVESRGSAGRYDYLLRFDDIPLVLRQPSNLETRIAARNNMPEEVYVATFYSMLRPLDGNMALNIYHPDTGELLKTVDLEDFVMDNDIKDDSYISILVRFLGSGTPSMGMDVAATIELPNWSENAIVPELRYRESGSPEMEMDLTTKIDLPNWSENAIVPRL